MFWLKLAPHGPFVRIPISLAQYRSHERPALDRKRARMRIQDEWRYLMEVLPALPWYDNSRERQIRALRQRRLKDLLNYLTQYRDVVDDEDCRARLAALAEASALKHDYESWLLTNKPFRPRFGERVMSRMKKIIRYALTK